MDQHRNHQQKYYVPQSQNCSGSYVYFVKKTSNHKLSQILTSHFEQSVKDAAHAKDDAALLSKIGDVDLIAFKAIYHRWCHRTYVNIRPKKKPHEIFQGQYESTFRKLVEEIDSDLLVRRKAFDTHILLEKISNNSR